ncbi:MAG: NAD-dependent epimerase/dehydratase family protein [Bacteroidota bacterium]
MKILIIGGTGFIGRPLVDKLCRHHELFVIHRSSVPKTKAYTSIQTHRKNLPTLRSTFAKIKPEIVIDIIPYFAQDA